MYQTIQQQIEQIKQERQAKYNAEIRLFQQINPHFLYITRLNISIWKSTAITPKNASMMIQKFSLTFMRIGLNFGVSWISISKELAHVQAYNKYCELPF